MAIFEVIFDISSESPTIEDVYETNNSYSTTEMSEAERGRLMRIYQQFVDNRSLDPPVVWTLICLYSTLIVVGTIGNIFVVTAVVRKPIMRTARNMFILNLAISDLLLCLVTSPLTLMEVVCKHWPLIRWSFLCKSIGVLQGITVFVSTITITAISLDRYRVIIYPTKKSLHVHGAIFVLTIIWLLALALVSPLYVYKDLEVIRTDMLPIDTIAMCKEFWPFVNGKTYYSAFSFVVQFIIPIIIVSTAYLKIYIRLKNRFAVNNLGIDNKDKERGRRMQKTNSLLIAIAVVYGISWLPLNLLNLMDFIYDYNENFEAFLIAFSMCHLLGMSSACTNPILYGWLNENFRKEFKEILSCGKSSQRSLSTLRKRESPNLTVNVKFNAATNNDRTQETENHQPFVTTESEITLLAK